MSSRARPNVMSHDYETQVIEAGRTYEVQIEVAESSVLSFAFALDDGVTVDFSILQQKSAKSAPIQLLPSVTQNAMNGEVLLPGRGTCLVRWHNPSGWLWSSEAILRYRLRQGPPEPLQAAPAAKAKRPAKKRDEGPAMESEPSPRSPLAEGEPTLGEGEFRERRQSLEQRFRVRSTSVELLERGILLNASDEALLKERAQNRTQLGRARRAQMPAHGGGSSERRAWRAEAGDRGGKAAGRRQAAGRAAPAALRCRSCEQQHPAGRRAGDGRKQPALRRRCALRLIRLTSRPSAVSRPP